MQFIKYIITVFLLLMPLPAFATTATVCDSGCDYATIAAALSGVGNGNHTITVQGTYTSAENLTITQSGSAVGIELSVQASGTQTLGNISLSGSYVRIKGFSFTDKEITDSGDYNIIENNIWYGTYAGLSGIKRAYNCSSCTYATVQTNQVKHWHYDIVFVSGGTSSNVLFYNNTITNTCSGPDIFRPFGANHIIKGNTIIDPSIYGKRWITGETLEVGECRMTPTRSGTLYWEVTTAGTTGESEPVNFNTSGYAAGQTLSDGTVTWTARTISGQHPDIIQVYGNNIGTVCSKDITIDRNKAYYTQTTNLGADGSWGSQIGNITLNGCDAGTWVWRNNIVKLSRALNYYLPLSKFYNNVFVGNYQGPLGLACDPSGCAYGSEIKNNIFIGNVDGTTWNGWYGNNEYRGARQPSTAYANGETVNPATHDGWHRWKAQGSGTSSSGAEPADFTINRSITANITAGSDVLTNVSSFTDIRYSEWLKLSTYINDRCYIDAYDANAQTITMKGYGIASGACGLKDSTGATISIIKSCNTQYEEVLNPTFDLGITSWSATASGVLASDTGRMINGLKVTSTTGGHGAYQDISLPYANTSHYLFLDHKNTAGDVAQYALYDNTNGAWITEATDLPDSTGWTIRTKITFTTPVGCTSVRLYLLGKSDGDIVWFDTVSIMLANQPYPFEHASFTDGTLKWKCINGAGGYDADYNYVGESPTNAYAAKTRFVGMETHGINGGDPGVTSYANVDFTISSEASILYDKGVTIASFDDDYTGTDNIRPTGLSWDIGAYEYTPSAGESSVTVGVSSTGDGSRFNVSGDQTVTVGNSITVTLWLNPGWKGVWGGTCGATGAGTDGQTYSKTPTENCTISFASEEIQLNTFCR